MLAAELAQRGVYSSSLPLLAIQALAETPEQRQQLLDLAHYCAVIVVSKPAARLILQRLACADVPLPALQPWFSVGPGTGQLLLDAGVPVYWSPDGVDSEALLQLPELESALSVTAPRVLIVRGEDGRELLAQKLTSLGAQVDYLSLYRRVQPSYAAGTLVHRVNSEQLNALLVSSGQGLQNLLQLAGADWSTLAQLPLFVPSARVAEQARVAGAQHVIDCRGVNTAALLAALQAESALLP